MTKNTNICQAVYEQIRTQYGSEYLKDKSITTPEDILTLKSVIDISKDVQENFLVITLTTAAKPIKSRIITKGLLNHSLVHPREIFRSAISDNAHSIICVHNHPSGSLDPSPQDLQITNQLKESGDIIGITLLDHIIVSSAGLTSLRQSGYL